MLLLCMSANAFGFDWAELRTRRFPYIKWSPKSEEQYAKLFEVCQSNEKPEGAKAETAASETDRIQGRASRYTQCARLARQGTWAELITQKLKTIARSAEGFTRSLFNPRGYMESTFAPFYEENRWGDSESASGPGSNLARTAKLRSELPTLLQEIGARTLVDAPCGDFNWMKDTELGIEKYTGVDVIPDLIARNQNLYGNDRTQFLLLDLTRDKLPRVDVILCRDCLIHFSYRHIAAAIKNFKRSGSTYLLTNSYPGWQKNTNIRTGDFRHINLTLPPFNFPPPLKQINEKQPEEEAQFFGKILGLWKLADL